MLALMNTQAYKIIENHQGSALVKRQGAVVSPQNMMPFPGMPIFPVPSQPSQPQQIQPSVEP